MFEQTVLKEELADYQKTIARLKDEIKTIQGFIASDERNVQHPVEAVRANARLSLDNYRNSLAQKQTELHDVQQDQQKKQEILAKMEAIGKKEQEVQQLERDRERIINLHERARVDLERLKGELEAMRRPVDVPQCELILAGGQRISLPNQDGDLLVGCKDAADGIFPEIDLTPFGGTSSGVSRRHATLSFRQGLWTIRDENSTNGTFVNETKIAPHVPKIISDQTNLRFGTIVATFALKGSAAADGKTRRLS